MEAVREDGDYYLFSPVSSGLYGLYGEDFELRYNQLVMEGKYHSKVKAREIFSKIVEARIHKYCFIMFIDTVCREAGEWIAGSNICTEIIGNHTKDKTVVCTLGSVNLSRCFSDRDIEVATEACVKLLHYSLLSSKAPTERGQRFNKEDQMIGCSFMGLAEYLSRMGFVAGTQEYLNEIERICIIRNETIQKYIRSTNGRFNPIRTTTSPPNESIAIICGTTSSHELPVSTNFTKGLNGKSLPIVLPNYKGKTAYELSIEEQIAIIKTLQKHTDQAISFNTYHSDMKFKAGIKYLLEQELSSDNSEALRREIDAMSSAMTKTLINEVSTSIIKSWSEKIKTLYYIRKEDIPIELAACQACAG
jgi:ribonucleotide reductase alpha subunit